MVLKSLWLIKLLKRILYVQSAQIVGVSGLYAENIDLLRQVEARR